MLFQDFSVLFALDEAYDLIRVEANGPIRSSDFIDRSIAFYASLDAPWRYHRLNDLTNTTGFVNYEDLSRMAAYWAPLASHITTPRKVAVVTKSRLVAARIPTINQLYVAQPHRVFATLADAEAWLYE